MISPRSFTAAEVTFFCYKQSIANLQTEMSSSVPAHTQGSPPAQLHHPQTTVRPCTLPQVVQSNTLLRSNLQLFGASQGDVLGTWLPICLLFRVQGYPGEGEHATSIFSAVLATIQVKKHLLFCDRSLWRPFKHPTCCTAELAILPETLL